MKVFFCFLGFFLPHPVACGILVPQPGTESVPPAKELQSLNHWTAREVPGMRVLMWERSQATPDWDGMEIYKGQSQNSKDEMGPGKTFSFASSGQGFHASSSVGKEQR